MLALSITAVHAVAGGAGVFTSLGAESPAFTSARELTMRRLGESDILVSEACLGGMTWGSVQSDEQEAATQLSLAWDFGINFFDTAEAYPVPLAKETFGATDRAFAKWRRATKMPRDRCVISTKVSGYNDRYTWMRESGEGTQLSKAQIRESIDASLARLETDYLDVVQLHWPERPLALTGPRGKGVAGEESNTRDERSRGITPIHEQVEAIAEAVEAGKVREWGLSNEDPAGVLAFRAAAEAIGLRPPAVVQNAYSLLQRADEYSLVPEALEPTADRPAISYLAYSPLSAGVLTGKYTKGAATDPRKGPKTRTRLGMFRGYEQSFLQTQGPKAVAAYVAVARKHRLKVTPSQLAIAHCASREFVTSTIIGATSTLQLAENLQAFSVEWDQQMEEDVLEVYRTFPDPWRVQVRGGG